MRPEQKKLLEPFGNMLHNWQIQLAEMTAQEFDDMEAACEAASPTDCWARTYEAAQILLRDIRATRFRAQRTHADQ
jgi:hypothetical protein